MSRNWLWAGASVQARDCLWLLFQSDGEIRYEACKDIVEGAELLVWYGDASLQFMGIPICLKSSSSNQQAVALEQDSECYDYCSSKSFLNDCMLITLLCSVKCKNM